MPRSISRTVEYSLNDFALSQVAKGEAPAADVEKYLQRSAGWQLLWDKTTPSQNTTPTFTGFLTPRARNGTFNQTNYNPATCGACSWQSLTYEGTPFEYSFSIPHDMETLIGLMGGPQRLEERLDYIFVPYTSQADLGPNGAGINTIMNIGSATLSLSKISRADLTDMNQKRAGLCNPIPVQLSQQAMEKCQSVTCPKQTVVSLFSPSTPLNLSMILLLLTALFFPIASATPQMVCRATQTRAPSTPGSSGRCWVSTQ